LGPLRHAIADLLAAMRLFSVPARAFLTAELLVWTGHGVFAVLFNLHLVGIGFSPAQVGQAVSANGLGLAIAALPAGLLAERWGRRRTLVLGAACEALGLALRTVASDPEWVIGSGFVVGTGQALFQIAAAPFLTEHSTTRERTHLFSMFFASALIAGVLGSALGGLLPALLQAAAPGLGEPEAYRLALAAATLLTGAALVPLLALRGVADAPIHDPPGARAPADRRRLLPIAANALLIGMGAGLVIPFMNLYFRDRFGSSSGEIGFYFAGAQVMTAVAALLGPAVARCFGKLRTAVASELLSLPFLVTLGGESVLGIAVAAFWLRATLMQAATPLLQAFVMEVLPPGLRARASGLANLVWNLGWAVSATLAGWVIERFGYAVPFYLTAGLYALAAFVFYRAFRGVPEPAAETRLSEEAKGLRGEGPATE
jgi:MFS family permease